AGCDFRCPSTTSAPCVMAEENGGQVAFTTFDPVQGRKDEVARVAAPPRTVFWDLSPDGSRIAYVKWAWDQGHKISILSMADKAVREVPVTGWTSLSSLAWSADGRSFFVISARREGSELLHVDVDGTVADLRKTTGRWLLALRPSPDGRFLAFAATTSD